ncbi:alpha/beta fold hydrolase [Gordonia rhizosphera]|uniref:Putative epoxide hydrolase n=1 Tax=Gordonia rhizosphera NBRC 16068 TaxID=1108045 RepID=K6WWH3_9ACTN|nr:alpha/beta fold hydrolase [Gordonia rhizosphera]GAB90894.1 putative epoxide hydrolase [Gordonia rhizosphera NBRC 16068]
MTERLTEFANGDLVFDVLDDGPIDGPPVVLLHGFPQRATAWELVAPLLHDKGFRTIAPDQRGYSPRARPPRRRDYRLGELAGDVIALVDALGVDRVDLVGHDWGGSAAWTAAARHPDRVRTLTAISTPHPAAFVQAMPRGQLLRSWYMAFFALPAVPEFLLARSFRPGSAALGRMGLPERFSSRLHDDIVISGALPGALNWYRGMPFSLRGERIPPVAVPTTFVWSDDDAYLGWPAARLTAGWVRGPYEFRVIRGADHWLLEKNPSDVAAAIIDRIGG